MPARLQLCRATRRPDSMADIPHSDPEHASGRIGSPPSGLGAERAIRGGAVRVLGYATGVLVSLGAAAILVRHLGIPSFGRYVTVTSLVALVGGLTEAGIVIYGIREFVVRDDADRRVLLGGLLAMRLALTVAGIAVAIVFGLVAGYGDLLVLGTLIGGAGLLAQVTADVLSVPLQAQLLLGRLTAIEVGRRILALLLIGVLAAAGAGLLPFFAAGAVAAAAAAVAMARAARAFAAIRPHLDWPAWRRLFADTLPYAVALSVAAVYLYVTVVVMSVIASATQTGLFGTSFRVAQAVLTVPSLLLTAIFPLISRTGAAADSAFGETVGKVFAVAAIFGTWMSIATILGAGFIIDVIAGHGGRAAAPVLRIQAIVFLASFVSTSSALGLVALQRYRPLLLATVATLVLDIVLGLSLVPSMGAEGGALADVIAEAFAGVGLTALLIRAVPEHQIRFSFVPKLALAAAVSAVVLALPIGSFGRAALASVLFFGVLLRAGALPAEVIDVARRVPFVRRLPLVRVRA